MVDDGKGSDAHEPFFKQLKHSGAEIEAVAIDMSPAYIQAVREHLKYTSIVFAIFVSIFALDVFDNGFNGAETVIALVMHMIPTAIVVIALVLSWKWEWIGALLFIGLSVFYPIWTQGKFHGIAYIAMSGPMLLAGMLFFMNWVYKEDLKIHSETV